MAREVNNINDKYCNCDGRPPMKQEVFDTEAEFEENLRRKRQDYCIHSVLEYELYDVRICGKAVRPTPCPGYYNQRRMCHYWKGNPGGR